jgi:hypothetical protein
VKTKFKVEPGDTAHLDDRWYAWLSSDLSRQRTLLHG